MLLDEAGVPFRRKAAKDRVTRFRIATADVPSWLVKDFGPWVLNLSARQAALVLEKIREWDGYSHARGHLEITSPRKDQMEWVVTIAALAGRAATLHWYPAAKSGRGRWVVYIRSSITTSLQPSELKVAKGSNPVFCPTVPSGYWLCRVSDRVFVTGNTQNLSRNVLGEDGAAEAPLVDAIADGCSYAELAAAEPVDVPVARKLALLVRPAIIATPKKLLIWADYSAIEARITPWLANSLDAERVLDIFRANDRDPSRPDIYTIAAADILHKDPQKITKAERSIGKVSVLACIAEDELVLTDVGLVPIENVTTAMRVWDGIAWVNHSGVVYKGMRDVITYDGLTATKDHVVFTTQGPLRLRDAAARGAHLVRSGAGRAPLRLGRNHLGRTTLQRKMAASRPNTMHRMRRRSLDSFTQPYRRSLKGLSAVFAATTNTAMAINYFIERETPLYRQDKRELGKLRRARHKISLFFSSRSRHLGSGESRRTPFAATHIGPDRQRRPLRAGESTLGDAPATELEQAGQCPRRVGIPRRRMAILVHHRVAAQTGRANARGNPGSGSLSDRNPPQELARNRRRLAPLTS
jgi:hypothetical protein